jgi:hypothetical protein
MDAYRTKLKVLQKSISRRTGCIVSAWDLEKELDRRLKAIHEQITANECTSSTTDPRPTITLQDINMSRNLYLKTRELKRRKGKRYLIYN